LRRFVQPLLAFLVLATGCSEVPYYAKKDLGRRILQLEGNDLEVGYQNKVMASREVSGGKPGHSAGGGCGCGN